MRGEQYMEAGKQSQAAFENTSLVFWPSASWEGWSIIPGTPALSIFIMPSVICQNSFPFLPASQFKPRTIKAIPTISSYFFPHTDTTCNDHVRVTSISSQHVSSSYFKNTWTIVNCGYPTVLFYLLHLAVNPSVQQPPVYVYVTHTWVPVRCMADSGHSLP